MALPDEVLTEKVVSIGKEIDQMSAEQIAALPTLLGSDFRLFGKITQCFCFIDLNLRRALEVFHLAGLLPEKWKKEYPRIRDASLTEALADVVRALDPKVEPVAETLTWLEAISKFRGFRNLAGHSAARGHPEADVYVFANKNPDDAKRAGQKLPKHGFHISIVGRSEFFEMVQAAKESEGWLGKKVPKWAKHYSEAK
jgi:hypothetical protein